MPQRATPSLPRCRSPGSGWMKPVQRRQDADAVGTQRALVAILRPPRHRAQRSQEPPAPGSAGDEAGVRQRIETHSADILDHRPTCVPAQI